MKSKTSSIRILIHRFNLFLFIFALIFFACKKEERTAVNPEIKNASISKDTLMQGFGVEDFFNFNFTYYNQYGEPGFESESDSIILTFYDLRFPNSVPLNYFISPSDPNGLIQINRGDIEVKVPTTCCANLPNGAPPCSSLEGYFDTVDYEVEYLTNFGYDFPKDTIQFIVDCSF